MTLYQVGQFAQFEITPVPSTGTQIYAYVWKLWDGTALTTTTPFTPPVEINIGGQPNGSGLLEYSVTPVQIDGQNVVINGSIKANNPPSIVPSPTISNNDAYFPYGTVLSVTAFDLDGDSFNFGWYLNSVLVGSGVSASAGLVYGTWTGNGTTIVERFAGTTNSISVTVSTNETIQCVIADSRGGVTNLDFQLRGTPVPPPQVGVSGAISGLVADASDLPEQRIGLGQTVTFSVYAKDFNGGEPSFQWAFTAANNWTQTLTTAGTISQLADGGFQSLFVKDVSQEIVTTGTEKIAIAVATITSSNSQIIVEQPVTLVANSPPIDVDFVVKNNGTAINAGGDIGQGDSFPPGTQIEFDAVAIDPDGDIIEYAWQFDQPPPVSPSTLNLWGAKVFVDSTTYPSGSFVEGFLTVTDRLGGTLVVQTPFVSIV